MPDIDNVGKITDVIIASASGIIAGLLTYDRVKEFIDYQATVNAITNKIYSTANKVTPELIEQTNSLIEQNVSSPEIYKWALTGYCIVSSVYFGVKAANKQNYME